MHVWRSGTICNWIKLPRITETISSRFQVYDTKSEKSCKRELCMAESSWFMIESVKSNERKATSIHTWFILSRLVWCCSSTIWLQIFRSSFFLTYLALICISVCLYLNFTVIYLGDTAQSRSRNIIIVMTIFIFLLTKTDDLCDFRCRIGLIK